MVFSAARSATPEDEARLFEDAVARAELPCGWSARPFDDWELVVAKRSDGPNATAQQATDRAPLRILQLAPRLPRESPRVFL